jgi:hypothetical protein
MEFLKKNLITIIILVGTLVLAGIAVFTAVRLYQSRQEAVAPNAPESRPQAASAPLCQLAFAITPATPTPSPTPAPGCYGTCTTPGVQSNCPTSMTCQTINGSNICVNPSCANNSNCICASATPTPTPTTPPQCGTSCTTPSDCPSSMLCYVGVCRNPSCTTSANCICASATPTPTVTGSPTVTPVPTATPTLPASGSTTPTIIGMVAGLVLIMGAIVLIL